ncbi:uncharacterized protein BT62DRAFT_920819 [Guyanagaster necrorhizus]|uniref:F-box domain-containing protein n=1 Tax=Guyanagaster necrorhizus TaxID=856835 RepID=A0A9P7VPL2_9AGAR|nr:uncharacterized protein BT62DRAFT_920819 [Guyanagaster necrorhizus MCA 3950]KAG7445066.1 hypothetical protein BT62DRAFT_920819 [Guyanagaster necrorhizus MCA 3950]
MATAVLPGSLTLSQPQDKYIYSHSFISLLQTNDPPTNPDATRTMMAQAADDIAVAERKIASLRSQIMEKEAEIYALRQVIDDCTAVLSPIRRLPTDLVLEIFRFVVPERYNVFDITRGPWLVTRICKRWRTLACTYGALWSSVHITNIASRATIRSLNEPVMLLQTALGRSSTFPLSVWFEYGTKKKWSDYANFEDEYDSEDSLSSTDSDNGEFSASIDGEDDDQEDSNEEESDYESTVDSVDTMVDRQLVKVLIQHSHQLQYLNIEVASPSILKCLRSLHGRLDRLEKVHISLPWDARDHNELQEAFTLAPKLCSVRLNGLSLESVLNFPLIQLKSLDHQPQRMYADVWLSTVQTILLQGSHLTDYAPPSPPKPYDSNMPWLCSYSIRTFRVNAWYVLDYFHLPGIDELRIRHFGWARDQSAGDTLAAFIQRSGCTLKKLHIRGIPDSILSAFPSLHNSLVELEITVTHSNERLLSGLSAFMRAPGHFSLLSRLEIKCSNEISWYPEVLYDSLKEIYAFVDGLWSARTKVRVEVCIDTSRFDVHRVCNVAKFKHLLDEGMDIAIFAVGKSKSWEDTTSEEEDDVLDLRNVLLEEDNSSD